MFFSDGFFFDQRLGRKNRDETAVKPMPNALLSSPAVSGLVGRRMNANAFQCVIPDVRRARKSERAFGARALRSGIQTASRHFLDPGQRGLPAKSKISGKPASGMTRLCECRLPPGEARG